MIARHPSDELPGLVRGELDAQTAASVYGHIDDCESCRSDLEAVRHASDALTAAAELGEEERLAPAAPSAPAAPAAEGRKRRLRLALLVIGLIVLVSVVAGTSGLLRTSKDAGPKAGPATTLDAVGGGSGQGQAKVTGDERRKVVTLDTLDLPAPGAGHYYEVWLARRGQAPAVALGPLATDNQGIWSVPASVAGRYDGQSIEVWLQPDDGGPAPNGKLVLRGVFRDS